MSESFTVPPMPEARFDFAPRLSDFRDWGQECADLARAQAQRADEAEAGMHIVCNGTCFEAVRAETERDAARAEVESLKAQVKKARAEEREGLARAMANYPLGNGFDFEDWMDAFRAALGGE